MRFFNILRKTAKCIPLAANPDQMDKNGCDFWTRCPSNPLQTSSPQKILYNAPRGMCAKLRTVAVSNNKDHTRNLSYYYLLALDI